VRTVITAAGAMTVPLIRRAVTAIAHIGTS